MFYSMDNVQNSQIRTGFLLLAVLFGALSFRTDANADAITNTATVQAESIGILVSATSNTLLLDILPPPTPAIIDFLRYTHGAEYELPADGGEYQISQDVFTPLSNPLDGSGGVINTTSVPVQDVDSYHSNDPILIRLQDGNRNADPLVREFVEVTIITSTGEQEFLRLKETGTDTGVFCGAIQSISSSEIPVDRNGQLFLPIGSIFSVYYIDPDFPSDRADDTAWVDPFGVVFDSQTGKPVNGAIVSIINSNTGLPATVYADDSISAYPNSVISGPGDAVVGPSNKPNFSDDSGRSKAIEGGDVIVRNVVYRFPPGGFRFPLIAPGSYILQVKPPPGYTAPSTVSLTNLAKLFAPAGEQYKVVAGSFGDVFNVTQNSPPIHIDIPIDPLNTPLRLKKSVSRTEASAGDFLQYSIHIENPGALTATSVKIVDRLPAGMRMESGSLRRDGIALPDPTQSTDGQTLTILIGDIAPNKNVLVTYVVLVSAGAHQGPAVNRAMVMRDKEILSNADEAVVQIIDPRMQRDFTIIGRVVQGDCKTPWNDLKGVRNIRLLMENGTEVLTDADGQYHFDAVSSGTHVVQIDLTTLPPYLTAIPCIQNSRFAGRAFSQFVEAQGGALWRADFYVGPKAPIRKGVVGINLEGTVTPERHVLKSPDIARTFTAKAEFPTLSAKLSPKSFQHLNRLASELSKINLNRIEVVGHTDSRQIRGYARRQFKDNYVLSRARAQSVADYLAAILRLPHPIKAIGRGADQPIASNQTTAGRTRNRRVEVLVYANEAGQVNFSGSGQHFRYRVAVDGVSVEALRVMVTLPEGISYVTNSSRIDGENIIDPEINGNTVLYRLGNKKEDWKHFIEFSGWMKMPLGREITSDLERNVYCPREGFITTTLAVFKVDTGKDVSTPIAEHLVQCPAALSPNFTPTFLTDISNRKTASVDVPADRDLRALDLQKRLSPISDIEAAGGGDRDWFAGQRPGIQWLFPSWEHNPRAPVIRIVIKHLPGQTVQLTHQDMPIDPAYFDRTESNDTVAISIWQGVPIAEGRNLFRAGIYNDRGSLVDTLTRLVHYANQPARVALVPEESVLVADGVQRPVVAIRLLDRHDRPVRIGVSGTYELNSPYMSASMVDAAQQRQLAGMDRFRPAFSVLGDNGIAYIDLMPTTETGVVVLTVHLQNEQRKPEVLRVWLEPTLRDWVVVGFAKGEVGYNTLAGNMQSIDPAEKKEDVYTDGNVSLYAKGRLLGKWLLTMAYSDKRAEQKKGLFSGIDPNTYYTLYGDTTTPTYNASSQENLYLKLSRKQFYFLFGDYDTALTRTQLSRYSRSFTGIKTQYQGPILDLSAHAAETGLHFAKDEIQGNGTSGLYPLSKRNMVINSEKIRIETRDRLKSEQIIDSKLLVRHLDYDIDYPAGTLFFREPIASRDARFNPIFIVAEYETAEQVTEAINAGGRVGLSFLNDRITIGLSQIRDENLSDTVDLNGFDMKLKLNSGMELRAEAAESNNKATRMKDDAFLLEVEQHTDWFDTLAYFRRQEPYFGINQQNGSESGMQKGGIDGRLYFTDHVALRTEIYRQEYLLTQAQRDMGKIQLEHRTDAGSVYAGAQFAADVFQTAGGEQLFRSEQAMVGANYFLLDKKVELQAGGEFPLSRDHGKESIDFPLLYRFGINYSLTESVRLILAQELSDGEAFRTSTTRAGFQAVPWKGARLTSTLNQSDVTEYGPRTFGQFGLTQALLVNERWGLDLNADSNRTFKEYGRPTPPINLNYPIASGGMLGGGLPPEDFFAISGGVTYRAKLWSWNGRIERRDAETTARYGVITNFLRQAEAGVAFGINAQAFETETQTGTRGQFHNVALSWAYRPLGRRWSILDRLEYRYDEIKYGTGNIMITDFGPSVLPLSGNNHSQRLINNITFNRVSMGWTEADRSGNLFSLNQRSQASLYYGAKYTLDQFNQTDYRGYTDLVGLQWRYDLTRHIDIGMQASALHSWKGNNVAYGWGPSLGGSPFDNGWITLGYNVLGFYDRDFVDAGYTRKGPYLQIRVKFDQNTGRGN